MRPVRPEAELRRNLLRHSIPGRRHQSVSTGYKPMLYTLALVLIIAWLLGLISSYTMGGFINILLVVAIIMILVRIIQGRKL
jgi:hypothetical protein